MPKFGPCSRRDLIRHRLKAGFSGPYEGGKHSFMLRGTVRLILPNVHSGDVSRDLLARILNQAEIPREGMGASLRLADVMRR